MGQDAGTCRFLQSNRDRREIYAIVERDGSSTAYGPLTYEQVDREVVHRLGLDRATLYRATHPEVADPGNLDAAGDPVFYPAFWDNWAIGDLSGRRSVNPGSYRFKAWLSYHK
jgi:hypothetical protein